MVRALVIVALVSMACSSDGSRTLPPRSAADMANDYFQSAGSALLAYAPDGAALALEVDLARLRDNAVLGPLFAETVGLVPYHGLGFDPMRDADVVAFVAYDLGSAKAETVTLVQSARLAELAGGERLASDVVAVGTPAMRKRVAAVKAGTTPPLSHNQEFMRLRDRAVPENAPGASVRLTARFDFDARVSLASLLDLSRVPTSVSLWGDVVDDLAIVAFLGAEGPKDSAALAKASRAQLRRVAGEPLVQRLVLGYLFEAVEVKAGKGAVQLLLVIDPGRLALLSKRLTRYARRAREQPNQPPPEAESPVPES